MTKKIALIAFAIVAMLTIFFLAHLQANDSSVNQQLTYDQQTSDGRYVMDAATDSLIRNIIQEDDVIPNQVMFYWCSKSRNRFEFRHFLSMNSVLRLLQPNIIFFLYDKYPEIDKFEYNTWLEELKQAYPFMYLEERKDKRGCNGNITEKLAVIGDELSRRGGYYIHETTILSPSIVSYLRGKQQVIGINRNTGHGFLMTQIGLTIPQIDEPDVNCQQSTLLSNHSSFYCVNTIERVYPKDIWELDSEFGGLARWAAYGETAMLLPIPDYTKLAPNVAHYVWIGNKVMDFVWYLSMLSVLYVLKVDLVLIHGEAPTGKYWKEIRKNDKVKVIYRYPDTYVFDQPITNIAHKSDVWRFDILKKYGGLYLDTDVIFVKPLSDRLRAYDAVINIDFIDRSSIDEYPIALQVGVMLGKPGSRFWSETLKTMRKYRDDLWLWNSSLLPYKVKERYPRTLFLGKRLQVNCFGGKCHPTWWPDYKSREVHHLNSNSLPNWQNDSYSYHFTGHNPVELRDENTAMHSKTIFGEMARYVLDEAGLI